MNEREGRAMVRAVKAISLVQVQHRLGEIQLAPSTYEQLREARKENVELLELAVEKAEDAIDTAEEKAERKRDLRRELLDEATGPVGGQEQQILFDESEQDNPEEQLELEEEPYLPGLEANPVAGALPPAPDDIVSDDVVDVEQGEDGTWGVPGLDPTLPGPVVSYQLWLKKNPFPGNEDAQIGWHKQAAVRADIALLELIHGEHRKTDIIRWMAAHTGIGGQHEVRVQWDLYESKGLIEKSGRRFGLTDAGRARLNELLGNEDQGEDSLTIEEAVEIHENERLALIAGIIRDETNSILLRVLRLGGTPSEAVGVAGQSLGDVESAAEYLENLIDHGLVYENGDGWHVDIPEGSVRLAAREMASYRHFRGDELDDVIAEVIQRLGCTPELVEEVWAELNAGPRYYLERQLQELAHFGRVEAIRRAVEGGEYTLARVTAIWEELVEQGRLVQGETGWRVAEPALAGAR